MFAFILLQTTARSHRRIFGHFNINKFVYACWEHVCAVCCVCAASISSNVHLIIFFCFVYANHDDRTIWHDRCAMNRHVVVSVRAGEGTATRTALFTTCADEGNIHLSLLYCDSSSTAISTGHNHWHSCISNKNRSPTIGNDGMGAVIRPLAISACRIPSTKHNKWLASQQIISTKIALLLFY